LAKYCFESILKKIQTATILGTTHNLVSF